MKRPLPLQVETFAPKTHVRTDASATGFDGRQTIEHIVALSPQPRSFRAGSPKVANSILMRGRDILSMNSRALQADYSKNTIKLSPMLPKTEKTPAKAFLSPSSRSRNIQSEQKDENRL